MRRGYLIIHPRARRYKQCGPLLLRLQERFDLTVEESRFPGQTREFARTHLGSEPGLFITAGGDGTFHEAVNGWADVDFPEGACFMPLPLGTGNDFLYSIDRRFALLDTYLQSNLSIQRQADLGRVTYRVGEATESRYFCVGATAGFSAVVTERRALLANRVPGTLSYLLALVLSFTFWKNRRLRVESEENPLESEVFLNFNAANVRHYGGGMVSAPRADPFDGALSVVSMNLTLGQALRGLRENFRGHFDLIRNVEQKELRKPFTVDCIPPSPVQADGEVLGHTPMTIECLPGKLPLLLPDVEGS